MARTSAYGATNKVRKVSRAADQLLTAPLRVATTPLSRVPHRKVLAAGGAGLLALIVLAVAIASSGGAGATGLSPALAGAPRGLVAVAFQAGPATDIDPNVLLTIAKIETNWGQARNDQPDDLVPADIRARIDAAALQTGGATATMLDLKDGRRIGDWVNPQPVGPAQEHAMGLMQFLPSTWRTESAAAAGQPRDPYQPGDALLTAGSYLHRLETGAVGGVPHDLRGALAVYGGSLAYADEVLSLAEPPAPIAGLPVVFPIPAPGWVQRIATPQWPADLAAHMSPSAATNQCVAGALATWAMMHPGDPRWSHPPPLFGNAIDLFGVARAEGFQLDNHPTPGAMVVYGSAYGVFGHVGTVRAVQGDRYEVIEQNFLGLQPAARTALGDVRLAVGGVAGSGGGRVRGGAGGGVRTAVPHVGGKMRLSTDCATQLRPHGVRTKRSARPQVNRPLHCTRRQHRVSSSSAWCRDPPTA